MSYAESLKRLREIQKGAGTAVPKVPKPPYGTFGTSSGGTFQKITPPESGEREPPAPLAAGELATAIVAIPATPTPSTLPEPPTDRTQAGLLAALASACAGLPMTLDELVREFGTEGEADWIEGYEPHCTPEYLHAFAEAVAERLERERTANDSPNPPEAA